MPVYTLIYFQKHEETKNSLPSAITEAEAIVDDPANDTSVVLVQSDEVGADTITVTKKTI